MSKLFEDLQDGLLQAIDFAQGNESGTIRSSHLTTLGGEYVGQEREEYVLKNSRRRYI